MRAVDARTTVAGTRGTHLTTQATIKEETMCSSGLVGVLVVLIMIGIAVLLGYLLIERRSRSTPAPLDARSGEHAAVALLKDRLARGEIDTDEFERRAMSLNMH